MKYNTYVTEEDYKELLQFGSILIENRYTGLLGITLVENNTKLRISCTSIRIYSITLEFAKAELDNLMEEFDLVLNQSCDEFKELFANMNKVYCLLFALDEYAFQIGEYSDGEYIWDKFVK